MTGLLLATTLGLADALARADRAPAVAVARAEAEVQRLQVDVARGPASPVLSLGTTRYSAREIVSVSQEIRWGGQRSYEVASARGLSDAGAATAALALVEARRDVRKAWFALAVAEDAETLGADTVRRAAEVESIVGARLDGGRASRLELVRARAEAARVAAVQTSLAEARRTAWARLASLIGLDPSKDGTTGGERPVPMPPAVEATLAARADALTGGGVPLPAIRAAESDLAAAVAAREASRRRLLPGLSITVGTNADDPGLPGPDHQAMVGLTLPVGARGAAAVRVAEAEQRVREARLDAVRREARQAILVAHRGVVAAAAQLAAYDGQAIPAALEAATLTREAYEAGRGDVLRVVDAERALLEVRAARLAAYGELMSAEADLRASAGELE